MKKNIFRLTILLLPMVCFADGVLSEQYSDCTDKSGGSVPELLRCIAAENGSQDARLNLAYKAAQTHLPAERAKQLQEVQRIWIKYRDANCKFYADSKGGAGAALRTHECQMNATASRATELENLKFIQP